MLIDCKTSEISQVLLIRLAVALCSRIASEALKVMLAKVKVS
jgi:hypothetical protein